MRQTTGMTLAGMLVFAGLLLLAVTAATVAEVFPGAAAQATIGAAVDRAFTQTAEANDADPAATAAFEETISAAINATLTATAQPPSPTSGPVVNDLIFSATTADMLRAAVVFDQGSLVNAADIKGEQVATGGNDGTVYLWDASTGDIELALRHPAPVGALRFNPARPELIVLDNTGTLYRWDTRNGDALEVGGQAETTEAPVIVGFSEDGDQFAVYTFDGTLTLWEYPDVAPASSRPDLNFALVDLDNNIAAYTYTDAPADLQLVEGDDTRTIMLGEDITFAEPTDFNSDGSQLIVVTDTQDNLVIDPSSGETRFTYPRAGLGLAHFSPDDTLIAGVSETGVLTLRDTLTGEELARREAHDAPGIEALFNESGDRLVSYAESPIVTVWEPGGNTETIRVAAAPVAPTATPTPAPAGPTPLPEGFPPITDAEVQVAEQVFEGGRMFWVEPVNQLWVMIINDEGRGQWLVYPDTFEEGVDPETDPNLTPPEEGLIQPERGFGKLWRENPEVRDALGWAITPEFGYVSRYRYVPGGEITDGTYSPGPGYHVLFSLAGEAFRFEEADGSWRLGDR